MRSEAYSSRLSIFLPFPQPFSWPRPKIPADLHSDLPIAIPLPNKPIPESAAAATTIALRRSFCDLSWFPDKSCDVVIKSFLTVRSALFVSFNTAFGKAF